MQRNFFKTGLITISGLLISGTAHAGNPSYPVHTPELVPANPTAGECYARVKIPAQFSETPVGVLVEDGYQALDVVQPQLATRSENVLVKEASVRYEVRQPSYRTITEKMMVRPSYDKLSVSAPQFKTITETVQTSAPRLVWKQGNPAKLMAQGYKIHSTADGGRLVQRGNGTSHYQAQGGTSCGPTCEIWCLVEEPGHSTSYQRKVLSNPGTVQRVSVPAKYQTIMKQVVSDPGGVREIPVPAEYRSVTVEDVIAPGHETYVNVEPKYASIRTKTLIAPERYEWRRVLCAPGTGTLGHGTSGSYSGAAYQSSSNLASTQSYEAGSAISDVRLTDSYPAYSSYQDRAFTGASHAGVMRTYNGVKTTQKKASSYSYESSNRRTPHRTRR